MSRAKRRRGARGAASPLWFGIAAMLFLIGLGLYKLTDEPLALVLTMAGLLIAVIVGWRGGRPEEGGNVGHPDINPWTIGR